MNKMDEDWDTDVVSRDFMLHANLAAYQATHRGKDQYGLVEQEDGEVESGVGLVEHGYGHGV